MSLVLIAVLIASHHECVSSYKPLVPRFLGSKLESFQSQLSKAGKALGSIVIASTLLSIPMNVEQVNAVDRYNNKLNAPTASGTRVNSDAESLLRYGLPIQNDKNIREIQNSVETCKNNLKTRRVNFAQGDIKNVRTLLDKYGDGLLKQVSPKKLKLATDSLARMKADIDPLEQAMSATIASGAGSVQEKAYLDASNVAQKVLSAELSTFEELMVPADFKRKIPAEYDSLPRLTGRAEVAMTFKKADGTQYDVDGKLYDQVDIRMVIDGYNAPLTGGNFIDLIDKGYYTKKKIDRADGFVVQTGDADPAGTVHGYVPPGSSEERKIPLEISLKLDSELLYGVSSEDDGRGSAATTLQFQSYGALGMAREEFAADSASTQFFWLLFESDLTPAGRNLLDGRYALFGYTLDGADLLKDVKEGDIIASAKVTRGIENLVRGSVTSVAPVAITEL